MKTCEKINSFLFFLGYQQYADAAIASMLSISNNYHDILTTFTYDSVLILYMSTPSSDSTLYRCEVCNETFSSQQEIERHNKEKHVETAGQKE